MLDLVTNLVTLQGIQQRGTQQLKPVTASNGHSCSCHTIVTVAKTSVVAQLSA